MKRLFFPEIFFGCNWHLKGYRKGECLWQSGVFYIAPNECGVPSCEASTVIYKNKKNILLRTESLLCTVRITIISSFEW